MSPFAPAGDRARWRVIYDIVRQRPIDSVVTYQEMGEALGVDPDEGRKAIQMAMRRAAKESEQVGARALEPVPNEGYRIVRPGEHLRLARGQQKRSRSALVRGQSKVVHVDFRGMDTETRKAFEIVAQAFSMQLEMTRRLDVRQERLEESIGEIQQRGEKSEEEIAALRARLDRLEGGGS